MIIITNKNANKIADCIAYNVKIAINKSGYNLKLKDYENLKLSILKLLKGEKKQYEKFCCFYCQWKK